MAIPLADHCACSGSFTADSITTHDRYQQDIPLPELTPDYQPQLVTKFVIQRAVCNRCGKKQTGDGRKGDLGGAHVTLGPNVRLLVTHLVSVGGMSYHQVVSLLLTLYGLHVSDGEIANMLHIQHEAWLPDYHQLQDSIRASPVVHADETSWSIQELQGHSYAWDMCQAGGPKVCFAFENSRGALHARSLFGSRFNGVRISDDYGVYRSPDLPGQQQLCWVHLYRVIRDLRYNSELPDDQAPNVRWWYEQFAQLYQQLRSWLQEPYDAVVRTNQAAELWRAVQALAVQTAPAVGEPQRLTRLKAQLKRAGQDRLFTCLTSDTPCNNNRAERDLRQLVLKRKRSFGSKTQRGAQALATVLSLCTTTWREAAGNPTGYFSALAALG